MVDAFNFSVCMTAISSILALATMPLNVFIYVRSWALTKTTVTPYINILIGVVSEFEILASSYLKEGKAGTYYKHVKI